MTEKNMLSNPAYEELIKPGPWSENIFMQYTDKKHQEQSAHTQSNVTLKKTFGSAQEILVLTGLQIKVHNWKLFFLFLNQNICCEYSKEPSQWDGSFEHPKH